MAGTHVVHSSSVIIPDDVVRELCRWARKGYPEEACGLLAGHNRRHAREVLWAERTQNTAAARGCRFRIPPRDWLRADRRARSSGLAIMGIWHSHPDRAPIPSRTDLESTWREYVHVIVGVSATAAATPRAWILSGPGAFEVPIEPSMTTTRGLPPGDGR